MNHRLSMNQPIVPLPYSSLPYSSSSRYRQPEQDELRARAAFVVWSFEAAASRGAPLAAHQSVALARGAFDALSELPLPARPAPSAADAAAPPPSRAFFREGGAAATESETERMSAFSEAAEVDS